MNAISRRLRKLEVSHIAQRNEHRLNPAEVLRQRLCRRRAVETGRPYEELLRERQREEKAFWASYHGDRSLVGILRRRFRRMNKGGDQAGTPGSATGSTLTGGSD